MTLLSRGIKSGGQGRPGFIDVAIAKAEGEKAQKEATLDAFSTQLEGLNSGGTYLGETSRTILAEFGDAFETAMDAYAADPSKENKDRLNQIKTQAKDFQHMAVAARQNSLNQYNAVRQNPDAYGFSSEKALEEFNERENASINARFDMDTMQMFFGDQETGEQFLGNAGYYNGQQPLYFAKKPDISDVEVPGNWGVSNFEKLGYLLNQEGGEEKILDAFKQTARFSDSAWRDTSVLNYLIEEKGISEDDPNLAQRIQEARNNPEELVKAIDYEAQKELDAMRQQKFIKEAEAARTAFQTNYRGDRDSRGERTAPNKRTLTETGESSDMYIDEFAGVESVRMLNTPITSDAGRGGVAGLAEYGEVINGLDVDALGRIVIQVDKRVPDPNDEEEETIDRQFHVLEDGILYDNLRNRLLREGTFGIMQRESIGRMEAYQGDVNKTQMARAYANSEYEAPEQFRVPTLAQVEGAQQVERDEEKTGPKGIERGLTKSTAESKSGLIVSNAGSDGPAQKITAGERSMDRRLKDKIRESNPDITDEEFGEVIQAMNDRNITVRVSALRNLTQRALGRPEADIERGVEKFNEVREALKQEKKDKPKQDSSAQQARDRFNEIKGRDFKEGRTSGVEGAYGTGIAKDSLMANLSEGSRKDYEAGGGVAVLTNNPGNLRPFDGYEGPVYYNKDNPKDPFRVFDTPEEGVKALERDVELKLAGEGVMGRKIENGSLPSGAKTPEELTIFDIISVYAPASENNPQRYSQAIADFAESKGYSGVDKDSPASSLPIEVLVEAIIKVESNPNHKRLTAQGLFGGDAGQSGRA